MRILLLTNLYPPQELGGYGRDMCTYATGLRARGHEIHVLTADEPRWQKGGKDDSSISRKLELANHAVGVQGDSGQAHSTEIIHLKNEAVIFRALHDCAPDVCLLGNEAFITPRIFELFGASGVPVVHRLGHQWVTFSPQLLPSRPRYRAAIVSQWVKEYLLARGYPLADEMVVYPGVDPVGLDSVSPPPIDSLKILFLARLVPTKGPDVLLEALLELRSRGVEFTCSFVGEPQEPGYAGRLRQWIAEHDLDSSVHLLGYYDDELDGLFARHNILVFPSLEEEGFGISQTEALAAGLVVVTSAVGGAAEAVAHMSTGLHFEPGNPCALANALQQLLNDPALAQRLTVAGRRAVHDKFHINTVSAEMEAILLDARSESQGMGPQPGSVFALASRLHLAGLLPEALAVYRQLLADEPDNADSLHQLGIALHQGGDHRAAQASIRAAIARQPRVANYHNSLGEVLRAHDWPDEAASAFRRALELDPACADAHHNHGNLNLAAGDFTGAVEHFRRALAARPEYPQAHNNLGLALQGLGRNRDASAAFRQALSDAPEYVPAVNNLGAQLLRDNAPVEALRVLQHGLQIAPDDAVIHGNVAHALRDLGEIQGALNHYRQALSIDPDNALIRSNMLFSLHHTPACSAAQLYSEHRTWARLHTDGIAPLIRSYDNQRDPLRPLRIGLVSGDLREHPVAFFLVPLIASLDRSSMRIICYSDTAPMAEDWMSERIRAHIDSWRVIAGLNNTQVAKQIQADRVDLLIDLAGHTNGPRLFLFALKPAPIQVSYLGYPNTTGMQQIDYRITDAYVDPENITDAFHSERLVRLPGCFLCYAPTPGTPPVGRSPAAANTPPVFGYLNRLSKLTPEFLDIIAEILAESPQARVKMLCPKGMETRVAQCLETRGVAPSRIGFWNMAPRATYLSYFTEVDVALDPFPYNGQTTTCDGLWMGVPAVTLEGDRHVSRVGGCVLRQVGLADLVARDRRAYVTTAVSLASDQNRLQTLRQSLRERMEASRLTDATAIAVTFQNALRVMWKAWCARPGEEK